MEKRTWRQFGEIKDSAMAEISFQQYLEQKYQEAKDTIDQMLFDFANKYRIFTPVCSDRLITKEDWLNAIYALKGVTHVEIIDHNQRVVVVIDTDYESEVINMEILSDLHYLRHRGFFQVKIIFNVIKKGEKNFEIALY